MNQNADETLPAVPFYRAPSFWLQTVVFAAVAYFFFGWLCIPITVRGTDMAPTYRQGKVTFCWRPGSWFGEPAPGDVVFIRFPETKRLLLRRVVAGEGDSVGFYKGTLVVNGQPMDEPYAEGPCDWHRPPQMVPEDQVFVVSDQRTKPITNALIGPVEIDQIVGGPLW